MAKPKVEYSIESKDKSKEGIKSAQSGLSKLASGAGASFKAIGVAVAAGTAALGVFAAGAMKLIDIYGKQEKAEIQLAAAARNNPLIDGTAVRGLMASASALQKISIFGDEALLPLMALGVNMGHTQETIDKVSKAAINLASATGMSLDAAFRKLYNSLGGVGGELGRTIPAVREMTEEQLKAGAAVDLVAQQFEGMAEAVANSTMGMREQLKNTFSDFLENLGDGIAPAFRAVLLKIQPWLDQISDTVAAHALSIANFFLYLPEIAAAAFKGIMIALKRIFTLDYIIRLIEAIFKFIWNILKSFLPLYLSYVVRFWQSIFIVARNTIKSIWEVIRRVGSTIWSPLSAGFEWAIHGIKVAWRGTMRFFATLIDALITGPINFIGKAFHSIIGGIRVAFEVVVNALISGLNEVLKPIDWILFQIKNIEKHGIRFGRYDEYQEGAGGVGAMAPIGLNMTEWQDLQSDLASKWEYALTPPDRNVGAEIVDIWRGVGDDIIEPWIGFSQEMSGVWDGFGSDLARFGQEAWAHIQDLVPILGEPWKEGFDAVRAQMKEILTRELPPELASTVDTLIESITAAAVATTSYVYDSFDRTIGDFEHSYTRIDWWKLFIGYMKTQFKSFSDNFKNAALNIWSNIKDFGNNIKTGVGWIVRAFKEPLPTFRAVWKNLSQELGLGGFKVVRALKLVGQWISDTGAPMALEAVGGALQWLLDKLIGLITGTEAFAEMMQNITSGLTSVFEKIIGPLYDAIKPLIDILLVIVGHIATILLPIIAMLALLIQATLPAFNALIGVVHMLGEIITQLAPIIFGFAQVMLQLLAPLLQLIVPLLGLVSVLLQVFIPILAFLIKIIDAVSRPFEFLIDIVKYVVSWFNYIARALADFVWNITHPFRQRDTKGAVPTFSSTAFTRPLIDVGTYTAAALDATTTSPGLDPIGMQDSSALTPSNYRVQNVTLNITVNTDVITGEGGVPELVRILYNEFQSQFAMNTI